MQPHESSLTLTWVKVIGDLWERYLKLLDSGVTDGFVFRTAPELLMLRLIDSFIAQ